MARAVPRAKDPALAPASSLQTGTNRAQAPSIPRRDIFEALWSLFCSVRFAVVQILVLATATTLGTLIPQMPPGLRDFPRDYADFMLRAEGRFGAISGLLGWAGFFDLYNSFWYRLLVVILCYSIVACTLNRWNPIMRLINPKSARASESFLLGLSERAQFSGVPLPAEQAAHAVAGALKKGRYRVIRDAAEDGTLYLYGDRDRWSKLVTFVSHAALVMLIVTAAGMTQMGWREQSVFFAPGEPVSVGHGTDFQVRQDGFAVEYYPNSSDVKEYWSNLAVIRGGQEVLSKTIRVNDPLRYENINFFLVSYVEGATVSASDEAGRPLALNPMGAAGPLTSTAATLDPMYLSFQFQSDDGLPMDLVQLRRPGQEAITLELVNYSNTPRGPHENPALFARAYVGREFEKSYYNDFIPRTGPLVIPELGGVAFSFTKSTATVMEVAEDHGLTPAAFWFLVMSGGFALSLMVTFVRCWAIVKRDPADPGRCDIILAGLAEKNKVTYERDFEKTALRLRDALTTRVMRDA